MASKRRPPLSPDMSEYLGLDAQGRHALAWPSCSRPGVRHFTTGDDRRARSCTCESYVYHPERPCLHMLAYPDALAYHLDPPPADPGDATPPGARHPRCPSMQCGIVGACCYRVCAGRLIAELGEEAGERAWWDRMHETTAPPADPGGAALTAAQRESDREIEDWVLGGKLSPPPWLVAPSERKRRHNEALRNLYGDT